MNRFQNYYEQLQLPIKTIFVGSLMIALGSIIVNPYINEFLKLDMPLLRTVSKTLLFSGGLILSYFPIYIFLKLLTYRLDEPNIVIAGVVSYIVFLLSLALFSPKGLSDASLIPYIKLNFSGVDYPLLATGTIGVAAVYLMLRYMYRPKKSPTRISQLSYFDKDTFKLVNSIIGAIALGLLFSQLWPHFIKFIYSIMNFVSSDVNNPMNLFAYGGMERILSLLNLDNILHQEMWLGAMGGSWMNLNGVTFVGDVNIWTAQAKETVNTLGLGGSGRFTAAFYVLNIFAIPGYLLALWTTITRKKSFNMNAIIFIGAVLVSMISGILLPVELMMLVTAPILYLFHLFMSSFIFAVLNGFGANLGFSFMGNLSSATPGSILDLFGLIGNPSVFSRITIIVMLGILIFLAYFFMTRFYYKKVAIDVLNIGTKQERVIEFIERLGGLENIEWISSTPTRVHVNLIDRDKLNVAGLHRQGVTRIVETRISFLLSYGAASYIIQSEINKAMKKRAKELELEGNEAI